MLNDIINITLKVRAEPRVNSIQIRVRACSSSRLGRDDNFCPSALFSSFELGLTQINNGAVKGVKLELFRHMLVQPKHAS